jgi:uncharacterized protein (DUF1697 family)
MGKYVAMLRGIGPGDPKMTSQKFKAFFEGLGFTEVQVVLASGNVIFASPEHDTNALTERIETALPQKLGFTRSVMLRSQHDLQHLIDQDPFRGIEQNHNKDTYLLITFFRHLPHIPFALPYTPEGKPYTLLGNIDQAVYGAVDLSHSKTPDYMAWLERQFGKDITSRTPKTIRLILARMNEA